MSLLKDNYGWSIITLKNNFLTRLDEDVFLNAALQMLPKQGFLDLYSDSPFKPSRRQSH